MLYIIYTILKPEVIILYYEVLHSGMLKYILLLRSYWK